MPNKLKFILSFPDFKEKGEMFNLYKGFVRCLNCDEAFSLLVDNSTIGLKTELIINSIINKLQRLSKIQIENFFENSLSVIEKLDWRPKSRVAKLLLKSSPFLDKKDVFKLTRYFLNSKYNPFRSYGYEIIDSQNLNLSKELLKAWNDFNDIEALELLINSQSPAKLFSLFNEAEEILSEAKFDFEVLKLRNNYYSKIIDFIPKKLSELLSEDPVSYVFVMKNANKQIPKDLALEIYEKNRDSRSIAACYGELGQWDVLLEIYNSMTGMTRNRIE